LKLDLSAQSPAWETVTKLPHARRGLAVAAHDGKLYVVGGMEEWGSTTGSVAIFDPRTATWSEGPSLLGTSMDGFGAAAFACGDALFVATSSGAVQRLSADGQEWEYLGMLKQPRLFHRLVPWQDQHLVVVGGVRMGSQKVLEPELLPVGEVR
jgi:N-acetylneuraminic acid mutarotase